MIGISYIRVSSQRQADEGVSLEVQSKENKRLLESLGCDKVIEFCDEGISAYKSIEDAKRYGIKDAVKKAQEVGASYFAVYNSSRLARNAEEGLAIYKGLMGKGIRLVSVAVKFEDTPEGKLAFTIFQGFDEYQSAKISTDVKKSIKELRSQGKLHGRAPIGYMNIRQDKKGWMIPNPKTAPYIAQALKDFISKDLTQRDLVRRLNRQGVKITKSSLAYRLSNPFYCGYLQYKDGKLSQPHQYECLISPEEFIQIQRKLNRPVGLRSYKTINEEFPLKRILKCPKCGKYLTGYYATNGSGQKKRMYDCKTSGCKNSKLAEWYEELFVGEIKKLYVPREAIDLAIEILKDKTHIIEKDHVTRRIMISTELKDKEEALVIALDTMIKVKSQFVMSELEKRVETLQGEIESLKATLLELDQKKTFERTNYALLYMMENPYVVWRELSLENKSSFQKLIFPEGFFVHSKLNFRTPQKALLYCLNGILHASVPNKLAYSDKFRTETEHILTFLQTIKRETEYTTAPAYQSPLSN